MRNLIFANLLILAALGGTAMAQPASHEPSPTIVQTGEGVSSSAPDEGYIVGGVVTTAETANASLAENAEAMTRVLSAIKACGVTADKIGTVAFSISDHYKEVPSGDVNRYKQVKDGYTVSNKIKATVSDLGKFGGTIDAMVAAGANDIDAIGFGNSKASEIINKARSDAVDIATARATLIAGRLGYSLGAVVTVSESHGVSRYERPYEMASLSATRASAPTPLVGGSQDFKVNVNVTWKLVAPMPKVLKANR